MARRRRSSGRGSANVTGLMFAPAVVMMRLPLMAQEAANGRGSVESLRAFNEKLVAANEGAFAATMSWTGAMLHFWPEVLAGKTPSLVNGVALERSLDAALAPAGRRVQANFRRLSKR